MVVFICGDFSHVKDNKKCEVRYPIIIYTLSFLHSLIEFVTMPYWYFDKKDIRNSPSFREGIDYETEQRYRREGARFIIDCGTKMDLGYNTMATGVVFFHRFYMYHSFKTFPRYVTASCCLFLAGNLISKQE